MIKFQKALDSLVELTSRACGKSLPEKVILRSSGCEELNAFITGYLVGAGEFNLADDVASFVSYKLNSTKDND